MGIPIRLTVTEELPFETSKRNMIKWKRAAFKAMGEFWHKTLLPKHFTIRARNKYGHRGRTQKYIQQKLEHAKSGRKWRRTGESVKQLGRVDNVLTGNLRNRLQSPALTTIKAFPSRATVRMLSIDYAPQRVRTPKQPDKIKEILTNTPAERKILLKVWSDKLFAQWKAFKQRKTTKTK